MRVRILTICLFFCLTATANETANYAAESIFKTEIVTPIATPLVEKSDNVLHNRFVAAILKSRSVWNERKQVQTPRWFECGMRVEKVEERADIWAASILKALEETDREYGTQLNPWGILAVVSNESGFDVCAIDYQSRKLAVAEGVVSQFQQSYSFEDVHKMVTSFRAKNWKSDLGPMQRRFRNSLTKEELKNILSLDPGMVDSTKEMAKRSFFYLAGRKGIVSSFSRPWRLWPTTDPYSERAKRYDRLITWHARQLGATKDEI